MLDLHLYAEEFGKIFAKTSRKPQSVYDYVGPVSAHREATVQGVMHTELHRLLVTNSKEADYVEQVAFSMKKTESSRP